MINGYKASFLIVCALVTATVAAKAPFFHLKNNSEGTKKNEGSWPRKVIKVELIGLNNKPVHTEDQAFGDVIVEDLPGTENILRGVEITYCPDKNICDRGSKEYKTIVDFKSGDFNTYYLKFSLDKNKEGIVQPQEGSFGKTTEGYSLGKNIKPKHIERVKTTK